LFLLMAAADRRDVALYHFAEAWRTRGLRAHSLPVRPSRCPRCSASLYGPCRQAAQLDDAVWNASPWPYAIPLGIALLVVALRRRNQRAAMGAGPCLSPFLSYHSLSVVMLGLVTFDRIAVAMCVLSWLPTVARLLHETRVIP
jgi:hypothetical protein